MAEAMTKPVAWTPPDPVPDHLLTERLHIRFCTDADAPAMFEAVSTSRSTLVPWMPWAATQHLSLAMTREAIEKFTRVRDSRPMADSDNAVFGYILGVFDRATGRLLGGGGFNRIIHDSMDAETGYWLRTDARGKGYCTEATRAIIGWGLTPQAKGGWGFRRVRIFAAAQNAASCAVMRRLGLEPQCRFIKDRWVEGHGWSDTMGWAVLASEWK